MYSTSGNDDLEGSGAEKVIISGVDDQGGFAQEEVTLDGTNHIDTAKSYFAVNDMQISQAGASGVNAGVVIAEAKTEGIFSRVIGIGNNRQR